MKTEKTIYLNDVINLNDYTVLVTYESGITESVNLSSFGKDKLNTSSVGNKTLSLIYRKKNAEAFFNFYATARGGAQEVLARDLL